MAKDARVRTKLREHILNSDYLKQEELTIPNWDNAKVEVRAIGLRERQECLKYAMDTDGNADLTKLYSILAQKTLYDPETKKRVFAPNDLESIGELDLESLLLVATVAARLLGIDLGEVEKNFEQTQNVLTGSGSPTTSDAP